MSISFAQAVSASDRWKALGIEPVSYPGSRYASRSGFPTKRAAQQYAVSGGRPHGCGVAFALSLG